MVDAQAGNSVGVVDMQGFVIVDDVWEWAAPLAERKMASKQPLEEGQV